MAVAFLSNLGEFQENITDLKPGTYRYFPQIKAFYNQVLSKCSKINVCAFGAKVLYFLKGQKAHLSMPLSAMGIPCFACAPERLPELLERTLKGQSLDGLAANAKQ